MSRHGNLPESAQPWWDQSSTTEEKRGAGNMIRMIKRNWDDKKVDALNINIIVHQA